MSRNLSDSQFEQVPMFDPGPESSDDRSMYFHYTDDEGFSDWSPRAGYEMHLGTGAAATQRAREVRGTRGSDDAFDSPAGYQPHTAPGRVHVARLREPLDNTPATRMSDPMANVLYNVGPMEYDFVSAGRETQAAMQSKNVGEIVSESEAMERLGARRKISRAQGRGAYYENHVEDPGSTSIVVKEPAQTLEHVTTLPHTPEFEETRPTEDREGLPTGYDPDRAYGQQFLSRHGTVDDMVEPSWRSKTFYEWHQRSLNLPR